MVITDFHNSLVWNYLFWRRISSRHINFKIRVFRIIGLFLDCTTYNMLTVTNYLYSTLRRTFIFDLKISMIRMKFRGQYYGILNWIIRYRRLWLSHFPVTYFYMSHLNCVKINLNMERSKTETWIYIWNIWEVFMFHLFLQLCSEHINCLWRLWQVKRTSN